MFTKDILEDLYVKQKLTSTKIASMFNTTYGQVLKYLKKFDIPRRNRKEYFKDLRNQDFHDWHVLDQPAEIISKISGIKRYWHCQCKCGTYKKVLSQHLINGASKSCGKCIIRTGENTWKGHGEISGSYWNRLKKVAGRRQLEFSISIEYGWQQFLQQNGKCAYSGIPITFKGKTSSLDRIDSTKGYIEGNIQWVHKYINIMKWDHTEQDFLDFIRLIAINKGLV